MNLPEPLRTTLSELIVCLLENNKAHIANRNYEPITSAPTPLTVYEPTGKFTTGGGWILDPTASHRNFGFTVRYNKKGSVQSNSIYFYRQNGLDYIVKSNAWIGLAITGYTSRFQGKAALHIYDPATGLLQPESSGNFQFTVEAVDNEPSKTPDTYKITVLDKDGLAYHTAQGQLQGGTSSSTKNRGKTSIYFFTISG